MPKIDEITENDWIGLFINYNDISSIVNEISTSLDNIENDVLDKIRYEMEKGGFDLYSVNINGVPIFHDKIAEIYQKLDNSYDACRTHINEIKDAAKQHRIDELGAYIKKLNEKISELNSLCAEKEAELSNYHSIVPDYTVTSSIQLYKGRREHYQEKLTEAQTELDKLG